MAVFDDGLLIDDGFALDSSPVQSSDDEQEFDVEAWKEEGRALGKRDTDSKWDLGAWLLKGEFNFPDFSGIPGAPPKSSSYDAASEITGLAANTLRDIASTYLRAVSVRTDACSWSHHRVLVNSLPKADEATLKLWLKRAVDEKLSVAALREALKAPIGTAAKLTRTFVVTVPQSIWEALKDLADSEQSTVQKIASQWLVENAESEDMKAQRVLAKQQTKERRLKQWRSSGRRLARNYPGKLFGSS